MEINEILIELRKKRQYCSCGREVFTYKRGKSHKVTVCSSCGIIATNPLPLLALAAPAIAEGIGGLISGASTPKEEVKTKRDVPYFPKSRETSTDRLVKLKCAKVI